MDKETESAHPILHTSAYSVAKQSCDVTMHRLPNLYSNSRNDTTSR